MMNLHTRDWIRITRQFLKEFKVAPVEKLIQCSLPSHLQTPWANRYHRWRGARFHSLYRQLQDILNQYPEPRAKIVFAPSLDWERQLFQRPQQLALALAERGALVFYTQIAPIQENAFIQPLRDRLYVCSLPLELFSMLEQYLVYTLTWNKKYLLKFSNHFTLYDVLDEIQAFEGDTVQLTRDHDWLMQNADLVATTASQLFEDARIKRPDSLYVPNGVDFDHFHRNQKKLEIPTDIVALCEEKKPIIGFYGAFAHWFDYDLMANLVKKRQDLSFLLIGPQHDHLLAASGLLQIPNVHYLGPKPYSELPVYLACFDVALLPFKINRVTQSTSPIKLFEYFAGGKPVISTPLREVTQYREVYLGTDGQEFSEKIDQALSRKADPEFMHRLLQIARENTWETRAEQILQAIEQKLLHTSARGCESRQS